MRADAERLADMLDAAEAMQRFTAGKDRQDLNDEVLFWALVAQIAILGEAAARVSDSGRQRLPEIPWTAIVGMRNQLVHGYWSIDRDELWRTISRDIPPLIVVLRQVESLDATFASMPEADVPSLAEWAGRDDRV